MEHTPAAPAASGLRADPATCRRRPRCPAGPGRGFLRFGIDDSHSCLNGRTDCCTPFKTDVGSGQILADHFPKATSLFRGDQNHEFFDCPTRRLSGGRTLFRSRLTNAAASSSPTSLPNYTSARKKPRTVISSQAILAGSQQTDPLGHFVAVGQPGQQIGAGGGLQQAGSACEAREFR